MAEMDRTAPRFYWNGIRPAGGNGTPIDVKCSCGITAIVHTSTWGLQCQPCYDAATQKASNHA